MESFKEIHLGEGFVVASMQKRDWGGISVTGEHGEIALIDGESTRIVKMEEDLCLVDHDWVSPNIGLFTRENQIALYDIVKGKRIGFFPGHATVFNPFNGSRTCLQSKLPKLGIFLPHQISNLHSSASI